MLSGMCVPDLRGTQGMFTYYTTKPKTDDEHIGGENCFVTREGNIIKTDLIGPGNPMRKDGAVMKCPFVVTIKSSDSAEVKVNGKTYPLKKNTYTEWVKVQFKAGLGIKVHGICKFMLLNTEPNFEL
jgi:hypothetical protein